MTKAAAAKSWTLHPWSDGTQRSWEEPEASQTAAIFSPTIEVSGTLASPSVANPFDVIATATFVHRVSARSKTVLAYYTGANDEWRWRFAGDEVGLWDYTTQADGNDGTTNDPDLHGLSGTVEVTADADAYGFIVPNGKRWARQKGSYDVLEDFVPQIVMHGDNDNTSAANIDTEGERAAFLAEFIGPASNHGFTGLHLSVLAKGWFSVGSFGSAMDGSESDPDLTTFALVEALINETRAAGGVVHIWPWGDSSRGESTDQLSGGTNGAVDQRLQRYICARLGCVAGWSMGYGFDLDEWVTEPELEAWHAYMQSWLPYAQPLGGRPDGPNSGTDHSPWISWNENMSYASYEHWEPTHAVYTAALAANSKPVMSEDRFRCRSGGTGKDYTETQTRQGLWISTICGGVANIWGQLEAGTITAGTRQYSNKAAIKTYHQFWFYEGRYPLVTVADDALASVGHCIRASDHGAYAFYAEGVSSVQIDLADAPGNMRVIAVDTTAAYSETVAEASLAPGVHTVSLGSTSDWALWVVPA